MVTKQLYWWSNVQEQAIHSKNSYLMEKTHRSMGQHQ